MENFPFGTHVKEKIFKKKFMYPKWKMDPSREVTFSKMSSFWATLKWSYPYLSFMLIRKAENKRHAANMLKVLVFYMQKFVCVAVNKKGNILVWNVV